MMGVFFIVILLIFRNKPIKTFIYVEIKIIP